MSIRGARLAALCALLCGAAAQAQPQPLQGLAGLQDHRARPLDAAALQGRIVLLNFVFTGCSSTCPLQVKELAAVHAALPPDVRQAVRFVSVTVDPVADTPATMAAFARRMDADRPGWHFTSGKVADLETLYGRLRAFDERPARPVPADHRTSLFLFDTGGTLMQRYAGVPVDRPRLVREITELALANPSRITRR